MKDNHKGEEVQQVVSPLKETVAASVRSLFNVIVAHPLDTIKVRMQTSTQGKYRSAIHCLRTICTEESFKKLYSGITVLLSFSVVYNSTLFISYAQAKETVKSIIPSPNPNELSNTQIMLAGMISGLISCLVGTPIDLIKTKQQKYKTNFEGSLLTAITVWKSNHIRGFYQGFSAHLLRDSFCSIYFLGYELCKKNLRDRPHLASLMGGFIGGASFWTISFPFDVIKSKMQADVLYKPDRMYPTVTQSIKTIHRTSGIRGFYSGFSAGLFRTCVISGLSFLVYDRVREAVDLVF
jgi:solute carrier family 25 carnitine/acylcarnitine transporter 20/29